MLSHASRLQICPLLLGGGGGGGGDTLEGQRQSDLCEFLYLIKGVILKHTTTCLNRLDFFLLFRVGNIYIFFKMHLMSQQSLPDPHLHNFIQGYQTKLCILEYYSCRNLVPKKPYPLKPVTSSTWSFISLLNVTCIGNYLPLNHRTMLCAPLTNFFVIHITRISLWISFWYLMFILYL